MVRDNVNAKLKNPGQVVTPKEYAKRTLMAAISDVVRNWTCQYPDESALMTEREQARVQEHMQKLGDRFATTLGFDNA